MLKKIGLPFALVLFCFCANAQVFNIKDYGAVADGQTLNTLAIQKAIDAATAKGGGKVVVPAGVFLTGTINLKNGVELSLDKGAVLLGSTNLSDYQRNDRWYALILADKQNNIAITGYGTIDGQGNALAKNVIKLVKNGAIIDPLKLNRPDEHFRPQLIELQRSTQVKIQHITLKNSSCWVETYNQCTDLLIDSITVQSTAFWNNDGIDIVDCKNVKVKNCNINAADDGICLKSSDPASACDNFEITDCKIRSSASAIKFGTASLGGFRNIKIDRIDIHDTYRNALSLEIVDGGAMENVNISNISAKHTGGAIFIRLGQRYGEKPGSIKGIHIKNVTVEIPKGKPDVGYDIAGPPEEDIYPHNLLPMEIVGLPGFNIHDVTLENINVTFGGGADKNHAYVSLDSLAKIPEREKEYPEFSMFGELPAWGLYVRHADGVQLKNVTVKYVEKDFRPAMVMDDVNNLAINGLNIPTADAPVIVLRGVNNQVIKNLKTPVSNKKAIITKN
jgi:polygalacturonase